MECQKRSPGRRSPIRSQAISGTPRICGPCRLSVTLEDEAIASHRPQIRASPTQALLDLPAQQWIRVRAEDLLGQPRSWLPRSLAWLGLDRDRRSSARCWNLAVGVRRVGGLGYGGADPIFLSSPRLRPVPPPDPEVIDPEWEISDQVRARISNLARFLGYGASGRSAQS